MPTEQEAGTCAFYVLVADDGSVLGRFNLYDLKDGTANLGYRVGEQAGDHGVATATVRELCRIAAARHGLRTLRAATSQDNTASQRELGNAPGWPRPGQLISAVSQAPGTSATSSNRP
jgi:RimJ/RimL family protein N-acetyltransferase